MSYPRNAQSRMWWTNSMVPRSLIRNLRHTRLIVPTVLLLFILILYLTNGPNNLFPSPSFRPHAYPYPPVIPPSESLATLPPEPPILSATRYAEHFPSLQLPDSIRRLPTLAKRLEAFLDRPIRGNTAEVRVLQSERCPTRLADQLVNPDQYNGDVGFWRGVDEAEIARRRVQIVRWLDARLSRGETVIGAEGRTGKGRGIVMTGGNQDTTLRLISVLRHLKRLKVDLPVEVFHYSDELHDGHQRREIESLGGRIIEVQGVQKSDGAWKNWQIKGISLLQSSFREILYLDSDNTPLRDPSHLFDAPIYLNRGRAVFWPDLSKDHPENAIWRIIGDTCDFSHWTFESAQIVIDKAGNDGLNYAALIIAAEMQGDREFWFHMCGGDKDTFRWAFRSLGIEWGVAPRWMSELGIRNQYEGDRFCGHTVLQHDLVIPEGFTREPPLFVHSNLLKHLGNIGLGRDNTFTYVKRMTQDQTTHQSLNHAHSWVYQGLLRGMCLDLDWHGTAFEDLSEAELELNRVEMVPVREIEGDVFAGFADAFFDDGGRIGGW